MIGTILNPLKHLGSQLKQSIKRWTKPATVILITGTLADMTRSRAELMVENAMLRQQLIVLKRQVKQPNSTIGINFD
jgi:hypothetical protein